MFLISLISSHEMENVHASPRDPACLAQARIPMALTTPVNVATAVVAEAGCPASITTIALGRKARAQTPMSAEDILARGLEVKERRVLRKRDAGTRILRVQV